MLDAGRIRAQQEFPTSGSTTHSVVESELGWGSPGAPLEVPGMAVIP